LKTETNPSVRKNSKLEKRETFEKGSILFKFKKEEDFNHRHT
jgi:hypothetical protein